jgi:hypothetical protein
VDAVVTRWRSMPFTQGSYSYVGVKATGNIFLNGENFKLIYTGDTYEDLSRPVGISPVKDEKQSTEVATSSSKTMTTRKRTRNVTTDETKADVKPDVEIKEVDAKVYFAGKYSLTSYTQFVCNYVN